MKKWILISAILFSQSGFAASDPNVEMIPDGSTANVIGADHCCSFSPTGRLTDKPYDPLDLYAVATGDKKSGSAAGAKAIE